MYQAIDAVSIGGVVQPLEAVAFDENERLVILRISKHTPPPIEAGAQPAADWRRWTGALKDSPSFNGDPVALQQALRDEWR